MAEFKLKPLSPFHIGQDRVLRGPLDLYLEGGILFLIHQEKLLRRFENHPGAWKAVNEYIVQTLSQPRGEVEADTGPRRYQRPDSHDRGDRGDRGGRGGRDDRGGRGGRDDRGG
ncbi:MAG TPA: hypothetical protein VL860_11255, partial [Planctomycetota bacterium]|nr:hypothetical protein [Planctomycetota bacterium]